MLRRKYINRTHAHLIGHLPGQYSVPQLYISLFVLVSILTFSSLTLAEVDCFSLAGNGSCEQETDPGGTARNFQPNVMIGNPVNLITGSKYQSETDFKAYGSELSLRRYYNSIDAGTNTGLGNGWRMTYHTTLFKRTEAAITIAQSNGRLIQFTEAGQDPEGYSHYNSTTRQDGIISTDKNYRYWHIPDGRRLQFRGPFLVAIRYSSGEILTLNYHKLKLTKISSSKGTFIELSYFDGDVGLANYANSSLSEPPGHLSSLSTSTGDRVTYGYDHNNNLVSVQYEEKGSIKYQYQDPLNTALLTKRQEYSPGSELLTHTSWSYSEVEQVKDYTDVLSGENITFKYVYSTENDQDGNTTVTRSNGTRESYHWIVNQQNQQITLAKMSVQRCKDCQTTDIEYAYGADYNLLEITGGTYNKVYEYDSAGRLVSSKTIESESGTSVSTATREHLSDTSIVVKESTRNASSGVDDIRQTTIDENGRVSGFSRELRFGASSDQSTEKTDLQIGRDDNGYYNQLTVNNAFSLEVIERSNSNLPSLVRASNTEGENTKNFEVSLDEDGRYRVTEQPVISGRAEYEELPDDSRQVIEERIKRLSDQLLIKELLEFAERVEGRNHPVTGTQGPHTECFIYRPAECDQVELGLRYAFLSQCVYQWPSCEGPGSEWEIVDPTSIGLTQADFQHGGGFKAVLVKNMITNEYVLSFAGSAEPIDFAEDILQAYGFTTPQYAQALDLANNVSSLLAGDNLSFTGHSLGGGLATAAALQNDRPAVVFNSAGLHPNVADNNGLSMDLADELVSNFVVDGDIVNTAQDLRPIYIPNPRPPFIPPYIVLDAPSSIGNKIPIPAPAMHFPSGASYANLDPSLAQMKQRHKIGTVIEFLQYQYTELGCEHGFTIQ